MRAMRMRVTSWATAVLLTLAIPFLPAAALIASADEGSPAAPMPVSPSIRPPAGVLRHVDAPRSTALPPTDAPHPLRELVVLVGGYQSCACPDDGTFDALKKRLDGTGGLDVIRFGTDPRFPYDTYGAIGPSARNLRDQVRKLAPDYGAVHVVTHSMGGVVADQAFAQGLSASDGVATYVSLAAPHSGSDAARFLAFTQSVTGTGALRESLLWLHMESDSAAVRDLAHTQSVAPPAGVVRLDLREASDVLVTGRDAGDPGVTSRVLTGAVEGHGGILTDPKALDVTIRTIIWRRVPPDDRSSLLRAAAQQESDWIGRVVFILMCALVGGACGLRICARTAQGIGVVGWGIRLFAKSQLGAAFARGLGSLLPRATRKPCP
jgi:hypothetical protein